MNELKEQNIEKLRKQLEIDNEKHKKLRQFERYECLAIALMTMSQRLHPIDGIVNEISAGGLRFRPASTFLLKREGEDIVITIDEYKFEGTIRTTRPDGYGIQLWEKFEDSFIEKFLDDYGEQPEDIAV